MRVVEGPLFAEVVTYYQHFQQTVRIHNVPGVDGLSLDITTLVDIRDQTNKELAMRLLTDIQSEDTFYTDLNGFQVSLTGTSFRSTGYLPSNPLRNPKVCSLLLTLQKQQWCFLYHLGNEFLCHQYTD